MMELKMNIPYKFENTPEAMEELCRLISSFIKKTKVNTEKILNININISGRVNPESGYSFSQFNFSERPLAEVLTDKIGCQVCIDNDTRAMTYGEYLQGCVKGEKNIIFVNISWGLGIGIIIDGKIYTGKSGFSGEFGHINVFDNEILCHCGKKDAWKQKHPVPRYIEFYKNALKKASVPYCPVGQTTKSFRLHWTKLFLP